MTRNQIDWQNMLISGKRQQEDARHNIITETELNRSNMAKEYLTGDEIGVKRSSLEEAIRHNGVDEWLTDFRNQETQRHNQMDEARNQLNVELQHLDRAESNAINKAFNEVSLATRELERLDKLENMHDTVANNRMDILNRYSVSLGNLENEVRKVDFQGELLPWNKFELGSRAVGHVSGSVKDLGSLFKLVK